MNVEDPVKRGWASSPPAPRVVRKVRVTHFWATTNLPEHWLLERCETLLTNLHRDDFANDKHDVTFLIISEHFCSAIL
jgi:hypothetical protein